jgi:GNAT superfamily N-acetyltransferase
MEEDDWGNVAELIHVSTNSWYENHGLPAAFPGDPQSMRLFCEVYEALDPGCCILAEHPGTGRLMGSGFYHPRETHVALGIMNVHPDYFGKGVASKLLTAIVNFADKENKPVRLVSSAINLDSFSLYSRAGFVARKVFQDMLISVPENGLGRSVPGLDRVRDATLRDVPAIGALELEISHIRRDKDFEYFIKNEANIWHVSVLEDDQGTITGALASVAHPAMNMLGPGFARTEAQAAALILRELEINRGRSLICLVPVDCPDLVQSMYEWGAWNCELHLTQVRGRFEPFNGVVIPTFMPETG